MRCPPFIMGGGHYAYSFVTKRVAEKSRYFRGAGHGLRALVRAYGAKRRCAPRAALLRI